MQTDVTAERVARNQSRFRDANEDIETAAEQIAAQAARIPFICECPEGGCRELTALTLEEYEAVRSRGVLFLVVPTHEMCVVDGVEVSRIAERHERFSVMEKLGRAGEIAGELDPRAR